MSPRANVPPSGVKIAPSDIVRRRFSAWNGIQGDSIEITRLERFEYSVTSPFHLLIAAERGERDDGETLVEGCEKSMLREFNRKLTLIPAGRRFYGWQDPRVLMRTTYLYLDPAGPLLDPELRFHEIQFKPRLFFFDRDIWETAFKLKMQVENPASSGYAEALSLVLHELLRLHQGASVSPLLRGGLASWQQKRVVDYIEDQLDKEISLRDLAALAQLSPFRFARAFKQSFGEPPHRYHMARPDRARQDAVDGSRADGDGDRIDARLFGNKLVHGCVSPLGRDHPIRLSPQRRLSIGCGRVNSAQFQSRHRNAQQALSRTIIT
jgi:AraC family transcriptional regulator